MARMIVVTVFELFAAGWPLSLWLARTLRAFSVEPRWPYLCADVLFMTGLSAFLMSWTIFRVENIRASCDAEMKTAWLRAGSWSTACYALYLVTLWVTPARVTWSTEQLILVGIGVLAVPFYLGFVFCRYRARLRSKLVPWIDGSA